MIVVCDPIHISHLNTILMLCDCVGERLTHLGIGLAYKLKSPASAPKYPCALFILKNGSLGELGYLMVFSLFGSSLVLLHLRDCKGGYPWRR